MFGHTGSRDQPLATTVLIPLYHRLSVLVGPRAHMLPHEHHDQPTVSNTHAAFWSWIFIKSCHILQLCLIYNYEKKSLNDPQAVNDHIFTLQLMSVITL